MCRDRLSIDHVLGNTILVNAHGGKHTEGARVHFGTTIRHDANNDLGPTVGAPRTGTIARTKMRHVLHHTVHGTSEENFIFLCWERDETVNIVPATELSCVQPPQCSELTDYFWHVTR